MTTFEDLNLNKQLLNALNDLGYTQPTPIQEKVFSVVMSGRDVCGIAQTGTGKTLAYLLPCLRQYQYSKEKLPQILVLVPTRELVMQVVDTVKELSAYLNLIVQGVYGGANMRTQVAELQQGVDVLVATPGRLIDILMAGALKMKNVKKLVIDEVDEMLNLGFRPQLERLLELLPQKRQNLLFSATLTDDVSGLMDEYFTNPVRVEAAPAGSPVATIDQSLYHVPNFHTKINLLKLLLADREVFSKALLFTATKQQADDVFDKLEVLFPGEAGVIHSNKAQNNRFLTVQRFEDGTHRILIATDLVARGIDVAGVSHVINLDVPETPENYVHRIGRTGRADRRGIALTLVSPLEEERIAPIEALMQYTIPVQELPEDLELSTELTKDEKPRTTLKLPTVRLDRKETDGTAFHDKIDKNKKVNVRRDHAKEKMKKYGRPIRKTRRNN